MAPTLTPATDAPREVSAHQYLLSVVTYTPSQQGAIEKLDAPLQLIAWAGSGKTQVISQRISRLLGILGLGVFGGRRSCLTTSP